MAYLDTAAAMKLVLDEPETGALFAYLAEARQEPEFGLVASWLLHTEMSCAVRRRQGVLDPEAVRRVLEVVTLIDLERADLLAASAMPGRLRAGDAIHLAAALRVAAGSLISYDRGLREAARQVGLTVASPR